MFELKEFTMSETNIFRTVHVPVMGVNSEADPALQTEFVEFLVQFRYLEKKIII